MKIEVELIAFIQKYAPDGKSVFDMELEDGTTPATVVKKLNINVVFVALQEIILKKPVQRGAHVRMIICIKITYVWFVGR